MFIALLATLAACAQAQVVTWASEPIAPGETLLLAGTFSDPSTCSALLSTTSPAVVPPTTLPAPALPGHASPTALKFAVPAALPLDVWALNLTCAGVSSLMLLNAPAPWWVQGDAGSSATPGGWLRVSGTGLALLDVQDLALRRAARAARRALRTGGSSFAAALAVIDAQRALSARAPAAAPVIRLTPADGSGPAVDIAPVFVNCTQFSLHVIVPTNLPAGFYNLSVSNGFGGGAQGRFTALDSFASPEEPHVAGIAVMPSPAWPADIFSITANTAPVAWPFNSSQTSDADVAAALAAALAAGGGTVALGPGTFFLSAPLVFPPRTRLTGAGAGLTAVYFAEATPANAPAAYFSLNDTAAAQQPGGVAAWGVQDVSIFISGFHFHVFSVSNFTDGWHLEGVTLRANAFFAQNNAGTATHGRWANWTMESPGNGVQLNAKNWRILNNDLFTSYNAITSFASNGKVGCAGTSWPNSCHGATYGWMADNIVRHGGSSHFMNQWRHVLYERNNNIGSSVIAMGQSVGTGPDGGYDHHILHADNVVSFVWGNDRELITYDDAGGAYFGPLARVDGATITTASDTKSAGDVKAGGWAGGCAVVLSGTGAGQYRRIVTPGIGAEKTNPNNRTWVLDAPFAVEPDASSIIQLTPYRGRIIFSGDHFQDGGAFQFYGQALDNIVADNTAERMTAFIAWGQWRGWTPANVSRLSGQMGNGLMPNMRNSYLRNEYVGAFSLPNYNYSVGYDAFYSRRFFATQPIDNAPEGVYPNSFLVYRNNSGGGGYSLAVGLANAVVDGGTFSLDPGQARQGGCALVDARNPLVYIAPTVQCKEG